MKFLILVMILSVPPAFATKPDSAKTPGLLCTGQDPNFSANKYPEKIPICVRNVSHDEKLRIAQEYGNIPESEWPKYEFDHLIPLSVGGSDDISNLWPQPIAEAKLKDVLENEIYHAVSLGKMTQAEAIQKVHDWIQAN
jgi:hypothetical protein